jgi:hypothetical protein
MFRSGGFPPACGNIVSPVPKETVIDSALLIKEYGEAHVKEK